MLDVTPISLTSVVIAQNQSLSPEVDIGAKGTLVGIVLPSTWIAAGLSFQTSIDGGVTWNELLDQTATGIGVSSVTGAAFIGIDPTRLRGVNALKVRSGTAASPVNQTNAAGVTLQLVTRQVF